MYASNAVSIMEILQPCVIAKVALNLKDMLVIIITVKYHTQIVLTVTVEDYKDLKNSLSDKIGKGIAENYEYTLSYLFMLGKIEYVEPLDSIKALQR